MAESETGNVKTWNDKGFGFITRDLNGDSIFVHVNDTTNRQELIPGSKVSFVFQSDKKGGKAKNVIVEELAEAAVVDSGPQEKEEVALEDDREMGKVKIYNEEKGFAFIVKCSDASEIFAHKREFPKGVEPRVGQPVSFVFEASEKGGLAKKIREEDSVPRIQYSDEGRDFGIIKNFNEEKGFGFIIARKGGEEYERLRFFDKALDGLNPVKHKLVSYTREDGEKGVLAKDIREEDPDRVARLTATVLYGKVVVYYDPPSNKPNGGYGFVVELDQLDSKQPKRHYFHMSEIVTPDDKGGIDMDSIVSFIIIPARKGTQAANVTKANPPKEEEASGTVPTSEATTADWGAWSSEAPQEETHVEPTNDTATDAAGGDWGAWSSEAPQEEKHVEPTNDTTADATGGDWGAWDDQAAKEETHVEPTNDTTADATGWGAWDDSVRKDETRVESADDTTSNAGAWEDQAPKEEEPGTAAVKEAATDATGGNWGAWDDPAPKEEDTNPTAVKETANEGDWASQSNERPTQAKPPMSNADWAAASAAVSDWGPSARAFDDVEDLHPTEVQQRIADATGTDAKWIAAAAAAYERDVSAEGPRDFKEWHQTQAHETTAQATIGGSASSDNSAVDGQGADQENDDGPPEAAMEELSVAADNKDDTATGAAWSGWRGLW